MLELTFDAPRLKIVPTVIFQGNSTFKSTLVSEIVGNPFISKDKLTRMKQALHYEACMARNGAIDPNASWLILDMIV